MKMRAALLSQSPYFLQRGWMLEEAEEGKGSGIMRQRLALSVQLLPGQRRQRHQSPHGLTEDSPHQHSHNAALAQTHK